MLRLLLPVGRLLLIFPFCSPPTRHSTTADTAASSCAVHARPTSSSSSRSPASPSASATRASQSQLEEGGGGGGRGGRRGCPRVTSKCSAPIPNTLQ